jgi:hypothetical protein
MDASGERAQEPPKRVILKSRIRSDLPIPSERFQFTQHLQVIARLCRVSNFGMQAVPTDRLEGEGVPVQAASLNVSFLTAIGLCAKEDRMYRPTDVAVKFVNAKAADESKGKRVLNGAIEDAWFTQKARAIIQTEGPKTSEDLARELAIEANVPYDRKGKALAVLTDYLVYSNHLQLGEDGRLRIPSTNQGQGGPHTEIELATIVRSDTPLKAIAPTLATAPSSSDSSEWIELTLAGHYSARVHEDSIGLLESALVHMKGAVEVRRSRKSEAEKRSPERG